MDMAFCKHAFVLSFYLLLRLPKLTFKEGMFQAVKLAGDTDTNACIAGGMVGAYLGKS